MIPHPTPPHPPITHTIDYKFQEFGEISKFFILKQPLPATHLLKLLDKICKHEMDPTSIVEDTERTRFCPQTDRQTDKVKPVYPPFNFVEAEGIINVNLSLMRFSDIQLGAIHSKCPSTILYDEFGNYTSEITATSPRASEFIKLIVLLESN